MKDENDILILNLDKLSALQKQEEHQRKMKENAVNQVIQKVERLLGENSNLRK